MFSGRVLSINRDLLEYGYEPKFLAYGYKVKFDVEKIWKGASEKTVVVSTGLGDGECGFGFKEGERYIVYAHGENSLRTSICSRTNLLAEADTDITALGEGKAPVSRTKLPTKEPINFPSVPTAIGLLVAIALTAIIYKVFETRKKS